MLDQLTWSLGKFALSACVLFAVGYGLKNTAVSKAWTGASEFTYPENQSHKLVWPAVGLAIIYTLEIWFLDLFNSVQDSTALDWAVVVLLFGGLVFNSLAVIVALIPALLIRASLVFSYSADPTTKDSFPSHGAWLLDTRFWIEEQWVWMDPGVILLIASAALGILFQLMFRTAKKPDYALWIGVPIAIILQGVFVLAANFSWGRSDALVYLQDEAIPATVALALVITLVVILLRAISSARNKQLMHAAELEAAHLQLKFLNAQIDPHFLNNSLNAVASISSTQPELTRTMIDNLALHYRAQCDVSSSLVPFVDEMKLVHCYLDIEQVRIGDRLVVEEHIDPACNAIMLPRLIIQPLIENAIQHGVQAQGKNGILKLDAFLRKSCLIVIVEDNGPGMMKLLEPSDYGTGLSNVKSRLGHFYNNAASLEFESDWGKGTRAILTIPILDEETR